MNINLTRAALRQLREAGIILDPVDDLDVILKLYRLATAVDHQGNDIRSRALLNPYLSQGNLTLRRLSIGAQAFLEDRVQLWFDGDPYWTNLSAAYCMAHATEPGTIWDAAKNVSTWKRTLRRWRRWINVPYKTMAAMLMTFQAEYEEYEFAGTKPDPAKPKPDPLVARLTRDPIDYGSMIDMLVKEYGQTADYWLWIAPEEEVNLHLNRYLQRRDIEARDKAAAAGKRQAPDPDAPHTVALRAFRVYVQSLKDERKPADA